MPGFRDNDASNQELYNLRTHNVDGSIYNDDDTDSLYQLARGLPDYGKEAYVGPGGEAGMVGGYRDVCVDVEPQRLFDGGGTRARYQYGRADPVTFDVAQGVAVGTDSGSMVRLIGFKSAAGETGKAVITDARIPCSPGTAANPVLATLAQILDAGALVSLQAATVDDTTAGSWSLLRSGAYLASGFVVVIGGSIGPQLQFFRGDTNAELGAGVTLTSGDVLSFNVAFNYTITT